LRYDGKNVEKVLRITVTKTTIKEIKVMGTKFPGHVDKFVHPLTPIGNTCKPATIQPIYPANWVIVNVFKRNEYNKGNEVKKAAPMSNKDINPVTITYSPNEFTLRNENKIS